MDSGCEGGEIVVQANLGGQPGLCLFAVSCVPERSDIGSCLFWFQSPEPGQNLTPHRHPPPPPSPRPCCLGILSPTEGSDVPQEGREVRLCIESRRICRRDCGEKPTAGAIDVG